MGHNTDYFFTMLVPVLILAVTIPGTSLGCNIVGCSCDDYAAFCENPVNMFSIPTTFSEETGQLYISGANLYSMSFVELITYPFLWNLTIISSQLSYIEPGAFDAVTDLTEIRLINNLLVLDNWDAPTYSLYYLTYVDLSYNQIQQLAPVNRFLVYSLSQGFHVAGNPLHCNCDLQWLHYFLEISDAFHVAVSGYCYTPVHLQGFNIVYMAPEHFKCSGPHVECTPNVTFQICDEMHLECRAYGDPQPTISATLPDGSLYVPVLEYDPSIESITFYYGGDAVDPTDGFGTIVLEAQGYEGSTKDTLSWTMEGDCGTCWEPCTTTTPSVTMVTDELTATTTETMASTTETDDVTTSTINSTTVDDATQELGMGQENEDFPSVQMLAAGGVGVTVGILLSLLALGVKHLVAKSKQARTVPVIDGEK